MPHFRKTSRGKNKNLRTAIRVHRHVANGSRGFFAKKGGVLPLLPLPILPLVLGLGPLVRERTGGGREGLADGVDEGRLSQLSLVVHNIKQYAFRFGFCKFIFEKKKAPFRGRLPYCHFSTQSGQQLAFHSVLPVCLRPAHSKVNSTSHSKRLPPCVSPQHSQGLQEK